LRSDEDILQEAVIRCVNSDQTLKPAPGANAGCRDGDLVRRLVPNSVTVVEGPVTDGTEGLWPEEAAHVMNAAAKRRREFFTGRRFARRAQELHGVPPGPLLVSRDRSPVWPAGVIGSITHTDRYCAVAVALTTEFAAIGIDVEDVTRFNRSLLALVLSPREITAHLPIVGARQQQQLGAAVFSAKEALYKCLSAVTTVRLGFRDCAVELDLGSDLFRVELLAHAGPFAIGRRFPGRYAFEHDLVGTAISLPAQDAGR
jgi:4'-phosphopantetheinyl transferase EntD